MVPTCCGYALSCGNVLVPLRGLSVFLIIFSIILQSWPFIHNCMRSIKPSLVSEAWLDPAFSKAKANAIENAVDATVEEHRYLQRVEEPKGVMAREAEGQADCRAHIRVCV
jgi:hypothetical protein